MSSSTEGIIGGAAVGGIIITLISIGLLYLIWRKKICRNKSEPDGVTDNTRNSYELYVISKHRS